MAFEPGYEKLNSCSLKRIGVNQAVVEARLLSQGGVQISKVLSIMADCHITPSELFSGEARYNGRVSFKVIYIDGEGKNQSMDYNADFTDKIVSDEIVSGLKPTFSGTILDTDLVSVDEREIKLACVVEVAFDCVVEKSVSVLVKGGENIYTHDDKIEFTSLVNDTNTVVVINDEIKDLTTNKILLVESRAIVHSAKSMIDCVVLQGNIYTALTCENSDGLIFTAHKITQFSEEVSVNGVRDGDFISAGAIVKSCNVTMESDGEKGTALLEIVLDTAVKAFRQEYLNAITDAFSVTNELNSVGQSVAVYKNKLSSAFSDRVEGSVTLDINMPIVDTILAVTGAKLNIANVVANNGSITYEGLVSGNVIYYNAEKNEKNSVAVELPFSLVAPASGAVSDDIVNLKGIVGNVTTKIIRGNEIGISAEIEVCMHIASADTKYIISSLELGEERVLSTTAFSVHIAKNGETLWDVAKALGTTPEIILLQNEGINLPLSGGERLIAYRQKKS